MPSPPFSTIGGLLFPILRKTIHIHEERNNVPNTATLTARAMEDGTIPEAGMSIELVDGEEGPDPVIAFRGYVLQVERRAFTKDDPTPLYDLSCVDFTWELDWHHIDRTSYALGIPVSATTIVNQFKDEFAPTIGDAFIEAGMPDIVEFAVEHGESVSSALDRVAHLVRAQWYVDYTPDLHFFTTPEVSVSLPDLDATNRDFTDFVYNTDISQLRTRVKVFGAASTLTDVVQADASEVPVADTTPFSETGGRAVFRNSSITYTGKTTLAGPGSLVGIPAGDPNSSVLTESYAGDSIEVLAIEEDAAAATALGTLIGTGPVYVEQKFIDRTLNDLAAHQAALADLELNNTPEPIVTFKTWNPYTTPGKSIHVDLTDAATGENIVGDFQIQSVDVIDTGRADKRFTRMVKAGRTIQDFFKLLGGGDRTPGGGGVGSSSGGGGGGGFPPTIAASVTGTFQVLPDETVTVMEADTELFDTTALWNPYDPTKLTIPAPGYYQITVSVGC